MNRNISLLIPLLLFSCKVEMKYFGSWVAIEEPFYGMSMEIEKNGYVFFKFPEIPQNFFTDFEGNGFISSGKPVFDSIQKEGRFNKETLSISLFNDDISEQWQILFSDGKTLELLLEDGYLIVFEKRPATVTDTGFRRRKK